MKKSMKDKASALAAAVGAMLAAILALAFAACSFDPYLSRGGSFGPYLSRGGSFGSSSDGHEEEKGVSYCDGATDHIYDLDWLKEWGTSHTSHSAILYACIDWDSSVDGNWTPVGDSSSPYIAIFDGGGHTVSGIAISVDGNDSADYAGFFGCLKGTVKNLGVEDASISGSYAGGIAGCNYGTIAGCWSTGSVIANASSVARAGGIAGYNYSGTIASCWFEGKAAATGRSAFAGGIAGQNYAGMIANCWSASDVEATASSTANARAGGIAGGSTVSGATIVGCYSTGDVEGYNVGGIVGYTGGDATMTACYSTGNVEGTYAGGIAGYAYDDTATITACYSTGDGTASRRADGIMGYSTGDITITACYWSGTLKLYSGSVNSANSYGTEVDGANITWKTAQSAMNEAISNSGVSWQYTGATASKAPTLVQD